MPCVPALLLARSAGKPRRDMGRLRRGSCDLVAGRVQLDVQVISLSAAANALLTILMALSTGVAAFVSAPQARKASATPSTGAAASRGLSRFYFMIFAAIAIPLGINNRISSLSRHLRTVDRSFH